MRNLVVRKDERDMLKARFLKALLVERMPSGNKQGPGIKPNKEREYNVQTWKKACGNSIRS